MDRPILFSAPMVCAILDGKKTQTRRIVKWRGVDAGLNLQFSGLRAIRDRAGMWALESDTPTSRETRCDITPCPYGQPGDRLWVREAFSGPHCMERTEDLPAMPPGQWPVESDIWYWADGDPTHGDWTRPRPSIHMPRFASRITLEITGVRVERLQDISEADAIAEGVPPDQGGRQDDDGAGFYRIGAVRGDSFPIARYAVLWESINGHRSWDANPWVWVVDFKRVTP